MAEQDGNGNQMGIVALTEQVKALVTAHAEIKDILRDLGHQMTEAERRANESCKSCSMWTRMNTVEKELAGINGRIAGMSLAAGALAFLGSFFVRR